MDTDEAWAKPTIGLLALLGGLCLSSSWLAPAILGSVATILTFGVGPVLVVALGIALAVAWRSASLNRWGRGVCLLGVAAHVVSWLAILIGGDVEGGIPVGQQVFWQPVWLGAWAASGPLLALGGLLVFLLRGRRKAA